MIFVSKAKRKKKSGKRKKRTNTNKSKRWLLVNRCRVFLVENGKYMEGKSRSEMSVNEELGRGIVSKNDQERRNKKTGGGEKKSLIVKRKEINATEQKWLPETACRDARLLVSISVLPSDTMITLFLDRD